MIKLSCKQCVKSIPHHIMATIFKFEPYSDPKSYKVLGLNTDEEFKIKMQPIYESDYKKKDN